MKAVVAMNSFKGCMSAFEACALVAHGFGTGFPEAHVVECPLADGGDGTLEVVIRSLGGFIRDYEVTGPYGEPVLAKIGFVDDGGTAVIESASACGIALVPPGMRDVWKATSRGLGELMMHAVAAGAKKIVVGIGGTAMNDGGIGAALACGAKILDDEGKQVPDGIEGLFRARHIEVSSLRDVFSGVEVVGISDVKNPLTGPDGATFVYGPQKGLQASDLEEVDNAMARYAEIIVHDLGAEVSRAPMAGAGGGLGAMLMAFFRARLKGGAEYILEMTGAEQEIASADLVITGEGQIDHQTAKGKVPIAVANCADKYGVPVIAVGGAVNPVFVRDPSPVFSATFSSTVRPMRLEEALAESRENLKFVAEQIGRAARVFALSFPVRHERCAGGLVVEDGVELPSILLIKDRFGYWAPPKGHIDPGEDPEQAAVREVEEETGVKASIVDRLTETRYRFFDEKGLPVEKTVAYYLMKVVSGSPKPRYGETQEVRFVPAHEIDGLRSYPNNLRVIREAIRRIREISS